MSNKKTAIWPWVAVAFVVVFIAGIVILTGVLGGGDDYVPVPDYGYEAEKLDVEVLYNDDYTLDVTEQYTIRYRESSHGFIRSLPISSGERYSNVKVDGAPAALSFGTKGLLTVRIGDEDILLRGGTTKDYRITYTVKVRSDIGDMLSYNVVGTDYDMILNNVRVAVSFKTAPEKEPTVHSGAYGAEGEGGVSKVYDGNTLVLTAEKLEPFHGITCDVYFPHGALKEKVDIETVLFWVAGIIAIAAAALLFFFFGKQERPVSVVNFYPPMGRDGRELTPAEMGFLIDHKCSDEDVTGMIFYWASKGCLEIEDEDGETNLILLKEPEDSAPNYEKKLFKQLFAKAKKDGGDTKVALSSLSEKFYDKIAAAKSGVSAAYGSKLYSKKSASVALGFSVVSALLAALAIFVAYFIVSPHWLNFFGFIAFVPAFGALFIGSLLQRYWFKLDKKRWILAVLYALGFAVAAVALLLLVPSAAMNIASKAAVGVACLVAMLIAPFMNRRTAYYDKTLGEIIGFRDFLRVAEKDKLEMLLKDDPQYYYNILPYANVLGVSKIWQDKFEKLTVEPPKYYRMSVGDVFMIGYFNRMYNRTHGRINNVMTSRPAPQFSSGGGSGSGGGFSGGGGGHSGGGFGGGGSRRW